MSTSKKNRNGGAVSESQIDGERERLQTMSDVAALARSLALVVSHEDGEDAKKITALAGQIEDIAEGAVSQSYVEERDQMRLLHAARWSGLSIERAIDRTVDMLLNESDKARASMAGKTRAAA